MPVSDVANITPIMTEVARLRPRTVLDLGVGFGKYGVLCREVLDATYGRWRPMEWEARIDGVEGFKAYANPCYGQYNSVGFEDFSKNLDKYTGYDLVLMLDSLEHLDATTGGIVLQTLVQNNKNVIVSVPLGVCPQEDVFGNAFETHRTTFNGPEDFSMYTYRQIYKGVCLVLSINGVK